MLNEVTGKYFYIVIHGGTVDCSSIVKFTWHDVNDQYEFNRQVNNRLEDLRYSQIGDRIILNQVVIKLDDIANDFIAKGLVIIDEDKNLIKKTIKPEVKKEKIKDFNLRIYKDVLDDFNITNEHDRKYIANKLASFYKKHKELKCIRMCRSDAVKSETELYTYLKRKVNSYYSDQEFHLYNEVTDTYFLIGFVI